MFDPTSIARPPSLAKSGTAFSTILILFKGRSDQGFPVPNLSVESPLEKSILCLQPPSGRTYASTEANLSGAKVV